MAKVCNMKGFCYMYSLQVGIAIIAAGGLTLTTTSVIVNISRTATAGVDEQNDSLGKSVVQYLLFLTFVTLGYVAFIFALMGAYKEEIKPLKVAIWTLGIQFLLWLVLTILSFVPLKAQGWTCVQSVRCADRFFIHDTYYWENQEHSGYSYLTDENPPKVFPNEEDCLKYCKVNKVEGPTDSGRAIPNESHRKVHPNITTTTNATTTQGTTASIGVIKWKANTTQDTAASIGVIKWETNRIPSAVNATEHGATTDEDDATASTITQESETPMNLRRRRQATHKAIPKARKASNSTVTSTTATSNVSTTQTASPRNVKCKCSKEEKEINSLIGKGNAAGHLALSIIFAILIALVWYIHSICVLCSYINFLKAPPPRGSRASKGSK